MQFFNKGPKPYSNQMAPTSWGPLAFAERLGGILGIFAMDFLTIDDWDQTLGWLLFVFLLAE